MLSVKSFEHVLHGKKMATPSTKPRIFSCGAACGGGNVKLVVGHHRNRATDQIMHLLHRVGLLEVLNGHVVELCGTCATQDSKRNLQITGQQS